MNDHPTTADLRELQERLEAAADGMRELRERLRLATARLDQLAASSWELVECCRLRGKAEGVRLALSYLPPDDTDPATTTD